MRFYSEYISERNGAKLYEDEDGFFSYRILGTDFFIDDLYVSKEKRKTGIGKRFSDKIDKLAKENDCTRNVCTVCVRADNYEDSFKFIQKMGYKVDKIEYVLIYLIKEI